MCDQIELLRQIGGWGYADPLIDGDPTMLDVALAVSQGLADVDPDLGSPFVVLTDAGWRQLTRMLEIRYSDYMDAQRKLVDMSLQHVHEQRVHTASLRQQLRQAMNTITQEDSCTPTSND